MKSTKIVATIGPASDSKKVLRQLIAEGLDLARLNFSHGSYEYFEKLITRIRSLDPTLTLLLDTKGPEVRSGEIEGGSIELKEGEELELSSEKILGSKKKVSVFFSDLHKMKKGELVLFDDGFIEAKVIRSTKKGVVVKIENGGTLGSRKTVALKGQTANLPFLSAQDKKDIIFGLKQGIDYIAASFVRNEKDIIQLRSFLKKNNAEDMKIIAKIEHDLAVNSLDKIIEEADGVMVARGDLGVDVALQKVPRLQKEIIRKCNEAAKPVIVATQMLESMRENSKPTRAEVSDVAQAILDGADAVMLSAETASGKYPVESLAFMASIAQEYDSQVESQVSLDTNTCTSVSPFIAQSAYLASKTLPIDAIFAPTESGFTARNIARFRPKVPLFAIVHDMRVYKELRLVWGVQPLYFKRYKSHQKLMLALLKDCHAKKLVKGEHRIVLTKGRFIHESGHTNSIEIYKVKDVLEMDKTKKK